MADDNKNMEFCLQQLLRLGKKNGGRITYKIIRETVATTFKDISLSTIDKIHQVLQSEQIEIVDKLYTLKHKDITSRSQKIVLKKRRSNHRQKNKVSKRNFACPEQAIDNLLLHCENKGEIDDKYFYKIVSEYNFSQIDIQQLVEYLGLKGIDCPYDYDSLFPNMK